MQQLNIYWISVDLAFKQTIPVKGFDLEINSHAKGVILNFGITAINEEAAKKILLDTLKEDLDFKNISYELEFLDVGVIEPEGVNKEIYEDEDIADSLMRSPYDEGLWYRSGKAYYND